MSENLSSASLLRILDHVPGAIFGARMDMTTGKSEWIYVNPRMAETYGVSEEEMRREPEVLLTRIVEEDRIELEKKLAHGYQTLEPAIWSGKVRHLNGETRWIETHTVFERAEDGKIESYGQVIDVTERQRLAEAVSAAEVAATRAAGLQRKVLDGLPVGLIVMEPSGEFPIYNQAAARYAGSAPSPEHGGDLTHAFGIFETDGVTPFPNERLPLIRALGGEEGPEEEMIVRNERIKGDCWVHVNGTPIRDAAGNLIAGMVAFQEVTQQRMLEQELRKRNEQLAASEEAKTGLIDRLRYAIDELSNPILEVWEDVLVMPIIGVVDSRRTADMVQRLLAEVTRTQASFVIIDLTGVEIVDTKTADHLMKLVRKVEIVGARCVLTGIRPAVSETLVDIGMDLGRVATLRNLKHGLREALRWAKRERDGLADLAVDERRADAR